MNIPFLKSKSPLWLAILFYTGIAASALLLTLLQFNSVHAAIAYTVVGLTFMLGVLAVTTMAQNSKQVVVYLDKKKETTTVKEQHDTATQSQLSMQVLADVASHGPQRYLNEICKQLQAGQGAIYTAAEQSLTLAHGYALNTSDQGTETYAFGEGLIGRVAVDATPLFIDKLPENYITIFSGLGSASPNYLVIVPIKNSAGLKGVLEIALFTSLNKTTRTDLLTAGETLAALI